MKKIQIIQQISKTDRSDRYKNKTTKQYANFNYNNSIHIAPYQFPKSQLDLPSHQNGYSSSITTQKSQKVVCEYHICTITPSINIIFNMGQLIKIPPFSYDIVFDENIQSQKVIAYQYQSVKARRQNQHYNYCEEQENSLGNASVIMLFPIMSHAIEKLVQNSIIKTMILMSKSVTIPRINRSSETNAKNKYRQMCKMIKKLLKNKFGLSYQQIKGQQYYKIVILNKISEEGQQNTQQKQLLFNDPSLMALDFQSIIELQKSSFLNFGPLFNTNDPKKTSRSASRNQSLQNSRNTIFSKDQHDGSQMELFYILFQKKIQNSFEYCLNYFKTIILPKIYSRSNNEDEDQDQIVEFYNEQILFIKKLYRSLISGERFNAIIGIEMCQLIKQKLHNYKYKHLKAIMWNMIIDPKITTIPDQQIQSIQQQIVQNIFQVEKHNRNIVDRSSFDLRSFNQIKSKAENYYQLLFILLDQMGLCVVEKQQVLTYKNSVDREIGQKFTNQKFTNLTKLFFEKLLNNQAKSEANSSKIVQPKNELNCHKAYETFLKMDKLFMQDQISMSTPQADSKINTPQRINANQIEKLSYKEKYAEQSLVLSNLRSQQMLLQNITEKDQTQSIKLIDQIFNQYSKVSLLSRQAETQKLRVSQLSVLSKQSQKRSLRESNVSNISHLHKNKNVKIQDKIKQATSKSLKQDIKDSLKSVNMVKKQYKPLVNLTQKGKVMSKSASSSSIMTPKSNTLQKTSISKSKMFMDQKAAFNDQKSNKLNKKQAQFRK